MSRRVYYLVIKKPLVLYPSHLVILYLDSTFRMQQLFFQMLNAKF
jgi:hypothetical protein